jgi:hypothetical protein
MLSANGGTRRLRITPVEEFVLGVSISANDKRAAQEEYRAAALAELDAKQKATLSASVRSRLASLSAESLRQDYVDAFAEYDRARRQVDEVQEIALPERLRLLRDRLKELDGHILVAGNTHTELVAEKSKIGERLAHAKAQLAAATAEVAALQSAYQEALRDTDYSGEDAAALYQKVQALFETSGPEAALASLHNTESNARSRLARAEPDALTEFRTFINEHAPGLIEERSDWRKGAAWARAQHKKLEDSTLVQYDTEANAAREAANQSFRADVAYRMREAIKRVHQEIADLNRILKTCPEFTNGEKYMFTASPSPTYRGLYDLIMSSALIEGASAPLFQAEDEVQKQLVQFLEDCESGTGKGSNPLEDYRLLFNFDLEIRKGELKVEALSKRLGVASNGEHLVPFYVMAGASLANAYRVKSGEAHDGAAVMIIDEAFNGFDAQNTYVTAEFLKSLGLQLIMAAPDSEVGKLVPILESHHDLVRFETEVFATEVIIKPAARVLFESDMPARNPHLLPARVKQLEMPAG